ncbi:methyl jasmonate esterase 1-like [Lycium ferocissimum]|uniref:methyl jasmonate esterase 1-like n=1 Tax=Lycium ferocissimum TaxID=112874 RepID=UPI0028157F3C|nr:methyl jasmonate esterase 1-like [Lycium ferocissimum]
MVRSDDDIQPTVGTRCDLGDLVLIRARVEYLSWRLLELFVEFQGQVRSVTTDKPPTAVYFGSNFLSSKMYQYSRAELKEATLTKEKYGPIPRVCIMCNQDLSMKAYKVRRWMIENNPPQDVKVILGSDHMFMFSKTLELCSRLMEIALKYH